MSLRGELFDETPSKEGKAVSQKTEFLTKWMSMILGILENGNILYALRVLSFIVLMNLSTSGTCSFSAHVFRDVNHGRIGTNSPSASMLMTEKPRWWYVFSTDLSLVTTVFS